MFYIADLGGGMVGRQAKPRQVRLFVSIVYAETEEIKATQGIRR